MINVNLDGLKNFLTEEELAQSFENAKKAEKDLYEGKREGNDYLGWLDHPINYDKDEVERIKKAAITIQRTSEVLVVVGIGGSYLGARAAIDALKPYFEKRGVEVIFAGNTVSSTYMVQLRDYLWDKDFSVNVVSKSGTTTEPALAYRFLYELLKKKYMKEELKEHIFFTTDKEKGTLHQIGVENEYEMFVVPSDMGGRYSVLSAVGLLPIAAAGFNIDKMLEGAKDEREALLKENNDALKYAAGRMALYNKDYFVEILADYEPSLMLVNEWWKQLYAESEGKNGGGIFTASCSFSTDLHSMGQYIQEGKRMLFETTLHVNEVQNDVDVPFDKDNYDGLNYLVGKTVADVNHTVEEATKAAHIDGGVPQITITLDEINEYNLGQLFYFFEKACGVSGYMRDINPFNQPGVEAYKNNMFRLLGKPGYNK